MYGILFLVVKFDKYCDDFDTITIYSDDVYYVKWSGTPLSDTCSFQFSPFDSDYKVCVEATSFYISSCSTRLKYYGGLIASDLEDVSISLCPSMIGGLLFCPVCLSETLILFITFKWWVIGIPCFTCTVNLSCDNTVPLIPGYFYLVTLTS